MPKRAWWRGPGRGAAQSDAAVVTGLPRTTGCAARAAPGRSPRNQTDPNEPDENGACGAFSTPEDAANSLSTPRDDESASLRRAATRAGAGHDRLGEKRASGPRGLVSFSEMTHRRAARLSYKSGVHRRTAPVTDLAKAQPFRKLRRAVH